MIRYTSILILSLASALLLYSKGAAATECLGPEDARVSLIYLHGVDTENPGDLELANRLVLQHIADKLGIRIALPRSPQHCIDGQTLCWNPIDQSSDSNAKPFLERTKTLLEDAKKLSAPCFQQGTPIYLLGFSSGGFLANKILRFCIAPSGFASVISVGASGTTDDTDPADLHNCEALTIINNVDDNYSAAENFATTLRSRSGNVKLKSFSGSKDAEPWATYDGKHRLPYEPTLDVLQEKLFDPNSTAISVDPLPPATAK